MKAQNDEKLVAAFPKLYVDRHATMKNTCMCWGFECGDGWFQLLWDLSEKLEKEISKSEGMYPGTDEAMKASQVKEKFGTLRFYMTAETSEVSKLIAEAEKKSAKTCDVCGKEGKLRNHNGWMSTRCDEHKA